MADTNPIVAELMELAEAFAKSEYMRAINKEAPSDYEPARAALESRLAELFAGEPMAWAVFDSQGFYYAYEAEIAARAFCDKYNKREADPLKPYTYAPLHLSPPTPTEAGDGNWRAISECSYIGTIGPCTPTEAGAGELLREWVQADSEWSALHPVLREQSVRKGITPLKTVKDRAREWVRNNPKG